LLGGSRYGSDDESSNQFGPWIHTQSFNRISGFLELCYISHTKNGHREPKN
jgi:hypothetical protein